MKKQMSTRVLTFAALAVVINLLGGYIVEATRIPLLFLDAIGTIFAAVLFGPWVGVLVGVVTNLVGGILYGPTTIPFALVSVVIAIVAGFIAKKWNFTITTAVFTGLILGIVAPLVGTPIVVAVYGGLTGSGTDLIVLWLVNTGQKIFAAAFLSRVWANLLDKVASCVIVFALLKALPTALVEQFKKANAA